MEDNGERNGNYGGHVEIIQGSYFRGSYNVYMGIAIIDPRPPELASPDQHEALRIMLAGHFMAHEL